ncbi:hypothetical protein KBG_86 [Mycobacterium phage KBG]|uniref:Uncharacterized protein n=3 Tax=Caudoviricetes TaxID=2731619 RepID=B3VG57_9CAUD|nr:hypothetical protein KBG_86 [Mycobacterium phage KBG]YP_009013727.1 hypothetical protein CL83_gp83 [Mycobacterium phage Doom]AXH66033.1 hypothetical protein SEA_PITA2_90 [Mycobacterium phage Pita2]QEA11371.1 MerR-like helix-turn-helix DNA binding domain protein [Mycobacterium phage Buttons]UYE90107.1 hypothetical protein PBI_MOLLY_88 [Mycobacterium phage Molly]WAB08952.1 hypothetical protein PBI_TOTE_85 [Mycobacterium phage Tote]WNM68114.1 helix-turn-helix DNA binding domain protein [Mycob
MTPRAGDLVKVRDPFDRRRRIVARVDRVVRSQTAANVRDVLVLEGIDGTFGMRDVVEILGEPTHEETPAAFEALRVLWTASARQVAEHLNISISAARRQLKALEGRGVVTSRRVTGYSDWGRMTTITEYMLTPAYAKAEVLETIPQMIDELGPYEARRAAMQYGITHEEYLTAKESKR